jgi:hypothetical protein
MAWIPRRVLVRPFGLIGLVPLVAPVLIVALGSVLAACSGGTPSGAVGTSGENDAFVVVDTSSPPIITVENRTAQPLVDVNLSIKSGMLTFTDRLSRLEANEKRPIKHGDFTSRDGTSFNLRVARPREVAVSARNLEGKAFGATLPWR